MPKAIYPASEWPAWGRCRIRAEAEAKHRLTAQWRRILVLVIIAILADDFLIALYAHRRCWASLPGPMGDLLIVGIGVGGYIVSRGVEKTVRSWAGGHRT